MMKGTAIFGIVSLAVLCRTDAELTEGPEDNSPQEISLELTGTGDSHRGRVEVTVHGFHVKRGLICGDKWHHTEAKVACRQLGYSDFHGMIPNSDIVKPVDSLPYTLAVKCAGHETLIKQCLTIDVPSLCRTHPAAIACELEIEQQVYGYSRKFARELHTSVVTVTKVSEIREVLKNATYYGEHVNGSEKLMAIKERLEKFFQDKVALAQESLEAISKLHYDWFPGSRVDNMADLKSFIDASFPEDWIEKFPLSTVREFADQPCNLSIGAIQVKSEDRQSAEIRNSLQWQSGIHRIFTQNFQKDDSVRWQYFADKESTVFTLWPATPPDRNHMGFPIHDIDKRERPWFINSVKKAKDIVIVLDTSTSMGNFGRLGMAAEIIKIIFDKLSKDDTFNVITSSSTYWNEYQRKIIKNHETLSCRKNVLVKATDANKKQLLSAIADVKADGASHNINIAVSLAFKLIKGPWSTNCDPVVVVLTDAEYHDGHDVNCRHESPDGSSSLADSQMCIFDWSLFPKQIRDINFYQNFKVSMFVYILESRGYIPVEMHCSSDVFYTSIVRKGADYKQRMQKFLEKIDKKKTREESVISVSSPYIDQMGLGVVFTLSAPVFSAKTLEFLGVLGIDVSLRSIEVMLQNQVWGYAYGFMMNTYGDALIHPMMNTRALLFPDIAELEVHKGRPHNFDVFVNAMLRRETGRYQFFDTYRPVHHRYENLMFKKSKSTSYFYTDIKGTEKVIGLAIGENDLEFAYAAPSDNKYWARTISLMEKDVIKNYHVTGLKLAPRAFCDPYGYIHNQSVTDDVILKALNRFYPIGTTCSDPDVLLLPAAYNDTQLTRGVSWSLPKNEKQILHIYFGTQNGVFWVYPAQQIKRNYDHTAQEWYKNTMHRPHKTFCASSVYNMYFRKYQVDRHKEKLITISLPIYQSYDVVYFKERRSNKTYKQQFEGENSLHGVLAVDINYDYIHELAVTIGRHMGMDCNQKCYVIDSYGNMVYDPIIKSLPFQYPDLYEEKSLSSVEGYVFRELIRRGIFVQNKASDFKSTCSTFDESGCSLSIFINLHKAKEKDHTWGSAGKHLKRTCIKTIVHYLLNESKQVSLIKGDLSDDPCGDGTWYFIPIEDPISKLSTNMFFLKIFDFKPKDALFDFHCHIMNRIFAAGSFNAVPDPCDLAKKNIYQIQKKAALCGIVSSALQYYRCESYGCALFSQLTVAVVVIVATILFMTFYMQ